MSNLTSSIKPEVHNVSQRPPKKDVRAMAIGNMHKKLTKIGRAIHLVLARCVRGQTDTLIPTQHHPHLVRSKNKRDFGVQAMRSIFSHFLRDPKL